MDVSSMARVSQGFAQYAMQAKNTTNSKTSVNAQATQTQANLAKAGAAFELDISDAAKQAQQTPAQTVEDFSVEDTDAQKTKGLSSEQVDALKADLETQEQTMLNVMIQALTESNDKLQGWFNDGVGILNFDGVQIDASRFALPEVATNAEDAAKAIAPGGAWSVDAVSSRIFDLASAIAGDDPEKLSQMRAAVEKGFEQAGMVWKDKTGQSNMPSITSETKSKLDELFDNRINELNGTSETTGASLTE